MYTHINLMPIYTCTACVTTSLVLSLYTWYISKLHQHAQIASVNCDVKNFYIKKIPQFSTSYFSPRTVQIALVKIVAKHKSLSMRKLGEHIRSTRNTLQHTARVH